MLKKSLSLLQYFCGMFLLVGSLHLSAHEPIEQENVETEAEQMQVAGNEATAESKIAFLQAQACDKCRKKEEVTEEEERTSSESSAIHRGSIAGIANIQHASHNLFNQKGARGTGGYYTTHVDAIFFPVLVGGIVKLDDMSEWIIEPSQSFRTLLWANTDQIIIRPNYIFWNSYGFILENMDRGESVEATLSAYADPMFHTAKNHIIVDIDPRQNHIWLEDGSVWVMNWWDNIRYWKPGHTVIIGINTGSNRASEPNILINACLIDYSRGACIR